MRNLKKALSLSLALVMLLGMMVVGAGAASFTDVANNSEKIEAIQVMNAIEVLQGYGDGTFGPSDTLTRAQAATIIAKSVMGPKVVEALNKSISECQFDDVNTGAQWAASVIQACANQGIIAGRDEKTFDPNGKVTGVEFAVMLLRALGFDQSRYTNNPNWAFNARQDAIKAGLNANNVLVSDAQMSRQDAAQMAFSAIQYSPSGEKAYTYNGQSYDNFFEAYLVAVAKNETDKITVTTASDSLAKTVFGLTKGTDTDVFGRTVETWLVAGKKDAVYTSTTPVGAAGSYATEQSLKADAFEMADSVDVYENSAKKTATLTGVNATAINGYTGNGVQVNVYKNSDGKVNKIVVVDTVLAQISNINETSKKVYLTVKAGPATLALKTVDEKNDCYAALSGMKKEDFVLVTAADGVVVSVTEPVVVTGIVSLRDDDGESLTVDGTKHAFAKVAGSSITGIAVDAKKEQMVYTDAAGNAYYATGVSATEEAQVVYVTYVYAGVNSFGAADAKMFQGVLPTGEVITGEYTADNPETEEVETSAVLDEDKSAINGASAAAGAPKAYQYKMNGSKYYLTTAANSASDIGAVALSSGTLDTSKKAVGISPLSTNYLAADVKVIYVNGQQDTLTAQVKDGKQVMSVNSKHAYAVVSKDADDNYIVTTVFIKDAPATANDAIIYVATAKQATWTEQTKLSADKTCNLYSFKVYVNGEAQTIWCKSKTPGFSAGNFYGYSIDEATGAYLISTAKVDDKGIDKDAKIEAGGVTKFNGTYYINDITAVTDADAFKSYDLANATVVDLSGGDLSNVEALRIKSNDKNGTALTVAMVANTEDKVITTVYVLELDGAALDANAAVTEPVAAKETVQTADDGTTTITADVAGTVQINGSNVTTITGTIKKGATIVIVNEGDEGGKLVIDGAVEKGASIVVATRDGLKNIELGTNANIADGSIQEVVQVAGEAEDETALFSMRAAHDYELTDDTVKALKVPVFAKYGDKSGEGFNIQDNTVAVRWQYGTVTLPAGVTEVTLKETVTDGKQTATITNTRTPDTADHYTMFCLTNPGDATNNKVTWTGKLANGFADANAGGTLTVKVEVYNGSTLLKTIVWFSMTNPVKP